MQVNVAIPFPDISRLSPAQQEGIKMFIEDQLIYKHQTAVAIFVHNRMWWARCSAQIWTEVSCY